MVVFSRIWIHLVEVRKRELIVRTFWSEKRSLCSRTIIETKRSEWVTDDITPSSLEWRRLGMQLLLEPRWVPITLAVLLALIYQRPDLLQIRLGQLQLPRTQVLLDVLDLLGARNRDHALRDEPGDGDLSGRGSVCGADFLETVHEAQYVWEVLLAEFGNAFAEVAFFEVIRSRLEVQVEIRSSGSVDGVETRPDIQLTYRPDNKPRPVGE